MSENFDNNIDDILKEQENDDDVSFLDDKKQRNKRRLLFIIITLISVSMIIVASVFLFTSNIDKNDEDEFNGEPSSQSTNSGQSAVDTITDFWQQKSHPQEVIPEEEWQKESYDTYVDSDGSVIEDEEEIRKIEKQKIEEVAKYNLAVPGVASNLQGLPSRSAGFTDNVNEVRLPDGTLNPAYSYWTFEGFNETVNFNLQRFINPYFGGWSEYQYPNSNVNDPNFLQAKFMDMYDPDFLQEVSSEPASSWLPVYADWNSDNYGGQNLLSEPAPRWMGSLENVSTTFIFDEKTGLSTAHVEAHVEYMAWSKTQQTLIQKGVITFNVVPGEETGNKYLLSDTKLEIL